MIKICVVCVCLMWFVKVIHPGQASLEKTSESLVLQNTLYTGPQLLVTELSNSCHIPNYETPSWP